MPETIERLWPYLVLIVVGVLPNEAFRFAGVALARAVDDRSKIFVWVRHVATALLAGLVAKLLFSPASLLGTVPLGFRLGAVTFGVAAFFLTRRSLLLGILCGEAALVTAAWALAR
jgi:hypothetical protein